MKKMLPNIEIGMLVLLVTIGSSYWIDRKEKQRIPEYILTYAENQPEEYPTTKAAYYFADLVDERSDGRIKIKIHAEGVLGDEAAVFEQLQYGGVDFTRVSIMTAAEYVPQLNVLQLPYLYQDAEHMWSVLNGEIGREFKACLDDDGVKGLSWYDAGARNFYTTHPVTCLQDLKGMRLRVVKSKLMESLIRSLGGIPVRMNYDEIYSGLELGEIDGAENNWPSYEANDHYKAAPYMLLDEHERIPELQLISEITWNKLSKNDQKIIEKSARESAVYQRELWKQQEIEARNKAESYGVVTTILSEEERAKFCQAVRPLYKEYGKDYEKIIQSIRMNTGRIQKIRPA